MSSNQRKFYHCETNNDHSEKSMEENNEVGCDIKCTSSVHSDESEATKSHAKTLKATIRERIERIYRESYPTTGYDRVWNPRLLRFGPLSGIFCMFLAVASLIASLGILAGSDNQPVERWSAPPSTYLAIFTAIANLSIRYAAIQGVVIAWWNRAMKGSNLRELHWSWYSGTTLRGALTAGRRMGLVGVACIFSVFVVIDGPLLQRASTTGFATTTTDPVTLDVRMVPLIPHGYTGDWSTNAQLGLGREVAVPVFNRTIPTIHGNVSNDVWPEVNTELDWAVVEPWQKHKPLPGVIQGCPETCKAKLKAPALFPTCVSHQVSFDAWEPMDPEAIFKGQAAPPYNHMSFMSWPFLSVNGIERIELVTGYSHSVDCKGVLNYTLCSAMSGIGEYEVVIERNDIIIDSINTPKFIALANNTAVNRTTSLVDHENTQHSTLGGVAQVLWNRYAGLDFNFAVNNTISGINIGIEFETLSQKHILSLCGDYSDPLPGILTEANRLMIYMGAHAAQKTRLELEGSMGKDLLAQVNTTTVAVETAKHYVFHTHYWFFVAAVTVDIVCILLIIPTYWGWWNFGRPVSFSPLEIAKAFESPIFTDVNSNSSARDIVKDTKGSSVKYGVLAEEAEGMHRGKRIAFGDSRTATNPEKGMQFPA